VAESAAGEAGDIENGSVPEIAPPGGVTSRNRVTEPERKRVAAEPLASRPSSSGLGLMDTAMGLVALVWLGLLGDRGGRSARAGRGGGR
jgi:hypothetical protein